MNIRGKGRVFWGNGDGVVNRKRVFDVTLKCKYKKKRKEEGEEEEDTTTKIETNHYKYVAI